MMNFRSLLVLFRNIAIKPLDKGAIIIPKGAMNKDLFYIRKGLVRSYYINEKGEEITFQLYAEYHIFGNAHSILFDEPSNFFFQALEQTAITPPG